MGILPGKRPTIKQSSFEKICRYFLGENWKEQYPIVELAIRNPKINFFDDELAVWTKKLSAIKTFNWNADPSAYVIKGQPKGILKKGVHLFTLSYHHKWSDLKRYVALRPATDGEQLPVWRLIKGKFVSSVATAIDQHKGGSDSTWSEGCQTAHYSQYPEFIQTIANAFDIKVQLGVVKKTDSRLMKGVGKFPYILIDQKDFNYIVALDESLFDSAEDLKYQAANFVGVPKIERIRPVEEEIENANAILSAVEIEEAENITLDIPQNSNQAGSVDEPPVAQNDAQPVAGDAPEAAPRQWLNVEDWKPFVFRMLWRVWAAFGALVTAACAAISGINFSDWRVWVALVAVVFVFLFVVALIVSAVLLLIWFFNRKEIVHFKTEQIKTAINPAMKNFGLVFERK